jgi:hypothetical protein
VFRVNTIHGVCANVLNYDETMFIVLVVVVVVEVVSS